MGLDIVAEDLAGGVVEHRVVIDGTPLTRGAAVELLAGEDPALRALVTRSVRRSPCTALFLEAPPVRRELLDRPWSFVLVDAPALAGTRGDRGAFAEHLDGADGPSATFENLGGDAVLIAPTRQGEVRVDDHAHLAAFTRAAADDAVDALWCATGVALQRQLDQHPDHTRWLSTSGLGVPWLHVRLDTTPKYYQHAPYRDPDA